MPSQGFDDATRIDEVISRFFAAFDNRDGRVPQRSQIVAVFAERAIIAKHQGGHCALFSPAEFVDPRIVLLTNGELSEFHEWEISARTEILGPFAVRVSRYQKSGLRGDAPYAGGGTKIFQLAGTSSDWKIVALSWVDDA